MSTLYVPIEGAPAAIPAVALQGWGPGAGTFMYIGSSTAELFVPDAVEAAQAFTAVNVLTWAILASTSSIACVVTAEVTVGVAELPLLVPVLSIGAVAIKPLK